MTKRHHISLAMMPFNYPADTIVHAKETGVMHDRCAYLLILDLHSAGAGQVIISPKALPSGGCDKFFLDLDRKCNCSGCNLI